MPDDRAIYSQHAAEYDRLVVCEDYQDPAIFPADIAVDIPPPVNGLT